MFLEICMKFVISCTQVRRNAIHFNFFIVEILIFMKIVYTGRFPIYVSQTFSSLLKYAIIRDEKTEIYFVVYKQS